MRLFWIIFGSIFCIMLYFLGLMDKASYEQCIADGKLSDETCYYYTYR